MTRDFGIGHWSGWDSSRCQYVSALKSIGGDREARSKRDRVRKRDRESVDDGAISYHGQPRAVTQPGKTTDQYVCVCASASARARAYSRSRLHPPDRSERQLRCISTCRLRTVPCQTYDAINPMRQTERDRPEGGRVEPVRERAVSAPVLTVGLERCLLPRTCQSPTISTVERDELQRQSEGADKAHRQCLPCEARSQVLATALVPPSAVPPHRDGEARHPSSAPT